MTALMTPLMSGETAIVIGLLVPLLVGLLTPLLAVRNLWRDAAGPLAQSSLLSRHCMWLAQCGQVRRRACICWNLPRG